MFSLPLHGSLSASARCCRPPPLGRPRPPRLKAHGSRPLNCRTFMLLSRCIVVRRCFRGASSPGAGVPFVAATLRHLRAKGGAREDRPRAGVARKLARWARRVRMATTSRVFGPACWRGGEGAVRVAGPGRSILAAIGGRGNIPTRQGAAPLICIRVLLQGCLSGQPSAWRAHGRAIPLRRVARVASQSGRADPDTPAWSGQDLREAQAGSQRAAELLEGRVLITRRSSAVDGGLARSPQRRCLRAAARLP